MARTAKPKTKDNTRSKSKAPAASKVRPVKKVASKRTRKAGAGRPSRLSREMILETSLKLLEQYDTEGFTLARVAEELDTVSMALYNYFPSREALLAELANYICKQFEMPPAKPGQDWKQTLRDWLWTLLTLAEKYPMMIKVTGVDGQTSAGWLRISRIVSETLYDVGFRDKEWALNTWLFCCKAISLVQAEVMGGFHSPVSLAQLEELEPEEQEHFLELRPFHQQITGTDVMEEGFADLIANLERKLPKKKR